MSLLKKKQKWRKSFLCEATDKIYDSHPRLRSATKVKSIPNIVSNSSAFQTRPKRKTQNINKEQSENLEKAFTLFDQSFNSDDDDVSDRSQKSKGNRRAFNGKSKTTVNTRKCTDSWLGKRDHPKSCSDVLIHPLKKQKSHCESADRTNIETLTQISRSGRQIKVTDRAKGFFRLKQKGTLVKDNQSWSKPENSRSEKIVSTSISTHANRPQQRQPIVKNNVTETRKVASLREDSPVESQPSTSLPKRLKRNKGVLNSEQVEPTSTSTRANLIKRRQSIPRDNPTETQNAVSEHEDSPEESQPSTSLPKRLKRNKGVLNSEQVEPTSTSTRANLIKRRQSIPRDNPTETQNAVSEHEDSPEESQPSTSHLTSDKPKKEVSKFDENVSTSTREHCFKQKVVNAERHKPNNVVSNSETKMSSSSPVNRPKRRQPIEKYSLAETDSEDDGETSLSPSLPELKHSHPESDFPADYNFEGNSDFLYLTSFLPYISALTPLQKLEVRSQINNIVRSAYMKSKIA